MIDLWKGDFGDGYIVRNPPDAPTVQARIALWATILSHIDEPANILEVGASVGNNLRALAQLTDAKLMAVEPNAEARRILIKDRVVPWPEVLDGTADKLPVRDGSIDLVFTSGVLIHIPPGDLLQSCREIHRVAKRYIVSIEYFSAEPEAKAYRGQSEALWKRDFGAFWLDHFPLHPVACGFAWKRLTGLDNLHWWVVEK